MKLNLFSKTIVNILHAPVETHNVETLRTVAPFDLQVRMFTFCGYKHDMLPCCFHLIFARLMSDGCGDTAHYASLHWEYNLTKRMLLTDTSARDITPRRVTCGEDKFPRHSVFWTTQLRTNVAAATNCRRHRIRFDRPRNRKFLHISN